MTIMVAGGLTFAIPGMEPAQAAQINSNPNLLVSAEGQNAGNEIAETNIVEVIVNDEDINELGNAEPRVTVGGDKLTMYQAGSGAWYGYFADEDFETIFDLACTAAAPPLGALCAPDVTGNYLRDTPARGSTDTLGGTEANVYLFELSGEFDIVYEKAGGDQTVTLDIDNPASGLSLDRNNYPQNTGVVATIEDQALNVDPTGKDTWTFGTDGNSQFYGTATGLAGLVTAAQTRNTDIDNANTAYETAIANVQFDRAEAKRILDNAIDLADEVITNPIAATTDKIRLIAEYGQGDRDTASGVDAIDDAALASVTVTRNDVTTATLPDFIAPANLADFDEDSKGLRQLLFESLYGTGDRDSNDAESDDYKGSLLVDYEAVAGTGDRDSNDAESDDYKGTALIALERVVGNGDRDVTPATEQEITNITEGTDPVPDDYRGSAQIAYDTALDTADIAGTAVTTALEAFDISDPRSLLTCEGDTCTQVGSTFWVTFTEDGDNDSIFTNAPDDEPNIKTTSDARRGLSFSIEYDNSVTSGIEYATTNIVIDAGDEWNSGEEIAITLTDSDANTNSLSEETLAVADTDRVIPTIRIGDPFTLAGTVSVELETADGADTDELRDVRTYREPTVTDVSDILVLSLPRSSSG